MAGAPVDRILLRSPERVGPSAGWSFNAQAKGLKSGSRFVVGASALLFATACQALQFDNTDTDLRLVLSEDFIHAKGSMLLSGRYGGSFGARAGFWIHTADVSPPPRMLLGADYVWTISPWRLGLGAACGGQS